MSASRWSSPATCSEFGHEHPHTDDAVSKPCPALPCPPWCNADHADHGYGAVTSHQVHRYASGKPDDGPRVTLYMHDAGTGRPELASSNGQLRLLVAGSNEVASIVVIDLDDRSGPTRARDLAGLLAGLGHEDIAADITELVAWTRSASSEGHERATDQMVSPGDQHLASPVRRAE